MYVKRQSRTPIRTILLDGHADSPVKNNEKTRVSIKINNLFEANPYNGKIGR